MDTQPEEFPQCQPAAGDFDTRAASQRVDCARWLEGVGRLTVRVQRGAHTLRPDGNRI